MMSSPVPRVAYWNNIPNPYIEGRFAALTQRGNLRFEGWFNARTEADRSWEIEEAKWGFEGRYIPSRRIAGRALHLPTRELDRFRPDVLISLFSEGSFALGSMIAGSMGTRVVWRIVPTSDAWFARTRSRNFAKHALFRAIDAAKVPGPEGAAVATRYGVPASRIFRSTQSIDVDHFAAGRALTPRARAEQRARLGLEGCVFLYVGRILGLKGLDTLFSAYRDVRSEVKTSLVLVGDGIDEPAYREQNRDLADAHFLGFRPMRQLPDLYGIADVVVFPTLGDVHGLVVDEAMAAGKPVISSDAAGDIALRIKDGVDGYIFRAGDQAGLADRMGRLARNPAAAKAMGEAAARAAAMRSHDRWAEDVERLTERVLKLPRRRTPSSLAFRAGGSVGRRLHIPNLGRAGG